MRNHYFEPHPLGSDGFCELCNLPADDRIHEMDAVPPDEPEFPQGSEPETVAKLFESYGTRTPEDV